MNTRNKPGTFSRLLFAVSLLTALHGCSVLQDNAKYNFSDGIYRTQRFGQERVYVLNIDEDSIAVFPVRSIGDSDAIDTKHKAYYTPTHKKLNNKRSSVYFYKPSFDLDVLAIPLKYRPSVDVLPNQMTTDFNGALYFGYRIDQYRLLYKKTPLQTYKRSMRHFGYSAGVMAGLCATPVNQQYISLPNFELEYQGAAFNVGIGGNIAAEGLSFGACIGMDFLSDKYNSYWVYQKKPWVGLTVGLDLY